MTAAVTTISDIRRRRAALGASRLSLAIKANVSTTHLAEIEAGRRPRGDALARVEAALERLENDSGPEAA
ncbi:MAG TPA: hypothetical protein VGI50_13790 [Solirubrobacteraceae bacterium]